MLSVIAVNHNSSALLLECLLSLSRAIGNDPHEFLVIDSGSKEEEVRGLRGLEAENVRVILSSENIGYARAVNMGVEVARGELILITNPDVLYTPDSIAHMMTALQQLPRCGAVGPRIWWNKRMTFLLPSSELITPSLILKTELTRRSMVMHRMILKRWIRRALEYWLTENPLPQEMLSGACIMTSRKVLDRVGGVDDSFPLYFEDTDWCLRAKKEGYTLYLIPQAHIIHYYNQSAKQDAEASQEKYNDSMDRYMRKHFRISTAFLQRVIKLLKGYNASALYEDKGTLSEPPEFTFRDGSRKLLLLSPVDFLLPSAGAFLEGISFEIPQDLWDLLGEGRYFVKVLDLGSFKECGSWSWTKQGPS
jgi:GT2 family glycosyltransferase